MPSSSPWIVETNNETFEQDVVERSRTVPVVVDFWAPWCQPCRMLGPMLERLAEEYQGKFVLVKANTDEVPVIASSFSVDSVPAVYAVRDGQIVNQFVGVLPEPAIRAWLERLLPRPEEILSAEARGLEASDPQAAEQKYREAIASAPNFIPAHDGLARSLLAQGRVEDSRRLLEEMAETGAIDAEGERLRAELALRLQGAGNLEEAREAAEAAPDNLQLQLDLARALAAAGHHREALDLGLRLVRKDRRTMGEPVREFMVQLFHVLGPEDELTTTYRRQLALTLY